MAASRISQCACATEIKVNISSHKISYALNFKHYFCEL